MSARGKLAAWLGAWLALVVSSSCVRSGGASRFAGELVLERAIAVAGPGDFQPSGLVLREGRLFAVCDKSSGTVLEIPLGTGAEAHARPAVPISLPGLAAGENLDLEGVALDGAGNFVVVSEGRGRVFVVRPDGAGARWLDPDFAGAGRRAGLLATPGAGFEGVAVLGEKIVLAAEREPRGLVVATRSGPTAWRMDRTTVALPTGRQADFADLAVDRGRLFGLVRNADAVVELPPAGDRFAEGRWWSFARAVSAHPYQDRRFGMAEGLAIDARHLYVILDNNGSPRSGTPLAPVDRRPMLFVFRRPEAF